MKIGINLVGVSYNDGSDGGRYRNYKDAIEEFYKHIINPLQEQNHELFFYIYTYDSIEKDNILKSYPNVKKYTFEEKNYNQVGGGDLIDGQLKMMSIAYINSLTQLLNEKLDIIISTRFDICFFKNPFKEYKYNFSKCNFLWREPEYKELPIINDTFIVFPHHMTQNLINSIINMESNPPFGVNIGLHNIYLPMIEQVGKENVMWVDDRFIGVENDSRTKYTNELYKLMRHE